MLVCAVDAETLSGCETAAVARLVDLLTHVAPETALSNSTWTAHDAGAHLVSMIGRYLKPDRQLPNSASEIVAVNQAELAEFDADTMSALVGRLRSRHAKYAAFWPELPLDQVLLLRGGLPLDVASLRTNWITELLIHGRDVALAVGEPWRLDNVNSLLALRLLANVLHTYLRVAGHDDYTLVVAGDGAAPFSVVIKDGIATVREGSTDGADRLAGPPETLVLLFYGRIDLDVALTRDASITGDVNRVRALLNRQDKP